MEESLDAYFRQCAMLLDVEELSSVWAFLAFDGIVPGTGKRAVSVKTARIVKNLMMTCGMYDGSGEFGVESGIPAKSGVGGGIVACVRGRLGIATYGPALDERGNSAAGLEMIRLLSERLDLCVL